MQIGSTLNEWLDVIQFMNFGKGYGNFKSYGKLNVRIKQIQGYFKSGFLNLLTYILIFVQFLKYFLMLIFRFLD